MEIVTINIAHTDHASAGSISLSGYPSEFINLIIKGGLSGNGCKTLNVDDAKALRDELIKIYPLPATVAEPSEYTVSEAGYLWTVSREVPSMATEFLCHADTEEAAQKVAKALNESEGL